MSESVWERVRVCVCVRVDVCVCWAGTIADGVGERRGGTLVLPRVIVHSPSSSISGVDSVL